MLQNVIALIFTDTLMLQELKTKPVDLMIETKKTKLNTIDKLFIFNTISSNLYRVPLGRLTITSNV